MLLFIFSVVFISEISFLEFAGRLDAEILTQFVDSGGNILVVGSNTVGK